MIMGGSRTIVRGEGGLLLHGERGSASLYGGLGTVSPVGSSGKAPGGELGGRGYLKIYVYFYWKKPRL